MTALTLLCRRFPWARSFGPLALVLLTPTLAGATNSCQAEPPVDLTPEEQETLDEEGAAFGLRARPGSTIKEGVAVVVVDSPPARVYRVVTDNCHFADFMPYVEESCVDVLADGSLINYQRLDIPFVRRDLYYRVRLENSPSDEESNAASSSWTLEDPGNILASSGSWTVRDCGDGRSLLTYQVWTDPGGFIRNFSNLTTKRALKKLIASVGEQAGQPQYASDSAEGCPCPQP